MLKLLLNPRARKLPRRFKLFVFKYFMSIRDRKNVQKLNGKKILSIYLPPLPSEAFDTFLDAQLKASRGESVPEIVNISLTTACENRCWHCTTSGEDEKLEKDILQKVIKDLKELGTFQFLFTGGNPLLVDYVEELVKAASGSSIALVSTPGPVTSERARALKKAGCQGVLVALEHHNEKKNDEIMGRKGAYEVSMESIKNITEAGMLTGTWIVVTSDRISQLDSYLKFVKKKGVTDVAIFEPTLSDSTYLLRGEDREYLLNIQKLSKRESGYPRVISGPFMDSSEFMGCTAGFNRMHITASGDVYPCDMLQESQGNINRENIGDIWGKMKRSYPEPLCGCLALENTDNKLPDYYRYLIRNPKT